MLNPKNESRPPEKYPTGELKSEMTYIKVGLTLKKTNIYVLKKIYDLVKNIKSINIKQKFGRSQTVDKASTYYNKQNE